MIKRSKEDWLSLFQQQISSGLSAVAFCKQHNLCDKHFSLRKKQLTSTASNTKPFVPIVIDSDKNKNRKTIKPLPEKISMGMQCRIGSCVLHFDSVPESDWLAQLLKALT
jgi:hypothetical protein